MSKTSKTTKALKDVIQLLTKFYESPSLANTNALVLIDAELPALRAALDDVERTEKGLAEWRATARYTQGELYRLGAVNRIAIGHLQALLNKARTFDDQQAADAAARDWLTSIGSEPT